MIAVIFIITDLMFPEAALPDGAFPVFVFGFVHKLGLMQSGFSGLREAFFDDVPAHGKVIIIFGQCSDAMQMVRK